ncbi:MAG: DUF4255 domain-containing protein [Bacteroidia bacterium]|nr:DUF4255 domain-containing protein [Bacteroidia bacterium]
MIDKAIGCIQAELNAHIKRKFQLPDPPRVVTSMLVDLDGKPAIEGEKNKLIVVLAGIEETRFKGVAPTPIRKSGDADIGFKSAPIYLTLYVLIASYFKSSEMMESLKFLSAAIGFFQSKPVFDRNNSPKLVDGPIDKLILEMEKQSFHEKSHLWGMMGAKYMPSVLYKVRLLTIQEDQMRNQVTPVKGVESTT